VLKFGIIAEGPTDQIVIENILLGYFQDQDDEPVINHIQPPRPLTETPAGWGHVFKSLERKDYDGALQYNDDQNPSLKLFVQQLDTLQEGLAASQPGGSSIPQNL